MTVETVLAREHQAADAARIFDPEMYCFYVLQEVLLVHFPVAITPQACNVRPTWTVTVNPVNFTKVSRKLAAINQAVAV